MAGNIRGNAAPPWRAITIVLRPTPLLTVMATSVALAVAFRTMPAGIFLAQILASWIAVHSIATLESLASGANEVPVLSLEMIFGTKRGWSLFLVMLPLFGLLFATGAASFWLGPLAAAVAGLLAAAAVPPALLVLGWTGSSAQAVSPRAWLHMARTLGGDFAVLECVAVVLIVATALLLARFVHVQMVLRIAALLLGWLLLIALAGTTIHARRADLTAVTQFYRGIDPAPSPEELARRRQHALDEIYGLWRGGAKSDAWQRIEKQIQSAADPKQELRWLYERVRGWEGQGLAARVAQELIHLDLLAGRTGYALKLARERLRADPAFRPRSAADTEQLARVAAQSSDPVTAAALRRESDTRPTR